MNSLTYSATTITLDDDLIWIDEFTWKQVEQSQEFTITGAQIIEATAKQAGRTITLRGEVDSGWLSRADVKALYAQAAQPARVFDLVIRGETARTVVFDHERGAIDAAPLQEFHDPEDGDHYIVTLRFIEV